MASTPPEEPPKDKSIPEHVETIKQWKSGAASQPLNKMQFMRTVIFTAFPAFFIIFIIYIIMTSGKEAVDKFCNCDP